MEEYEFKKNVKKVLGPRKHKVTNSYGVYDGYKYYRKNKPKDKKYILTESQYFAIIRKINLLLVDRLIQGDDIEFPCGMGKIQVKKYNPTFILKEGKVKTNLPIDWDNTLKLWYEDEDAYRNKTLIKIKERVLFKIVYNKGHANYNNQSYYQYTPNRDLKLRLKRAIKDNNFDAFTQ